MTRMCETSCDRTRCGRELGVSPELLRVNAIDAIRRSQSQDGEESMRSMFPVKDSALSVIALAILTWRALLLHCT